MIDIADHACKMKGNQSQIVGKGHPAEVSVVVVQFRFGSSVAYVVHQVFMSQHDTFRVSRRSGRKLDESQAIRLNRTNNAFGLRAIIQAFRWQCGLRHYAEGLLKPLLSRVLFQAFQHFGIADQIRAAQRVPNFEQLHLMFVVAADRHRNRHDAAQQTSPKDMQKRTVLVNLHQQFISGLHSARLQIMQRLKRMFE